MKPVALPALSAVFLSIIGFGQEADDGDRILFNTPNEWRGEVIKLPPGFAPTLKWHGTESIRFAPGMFEPDSDSFFSYVLVFLLSKDDDVSDAAIQAQVLTYYQGLAGAVMKAGNDVTDQFKLTLEKAEKEAMPAPAAAKGQEVSSWTGKLQWVEPFRTRAAQTLNIEIQLWKNGERPVLYFAVSPRETDHAIWEEMRKYRAAFELK